MEVDEVQWLEQGMKMPRAIKDKDDERLVFKHMKRTIVKDVLDISEGEGNLERETPSVCSTKTGG